MSLDDIQTRATTTPIKVYLLKKSAPYHLPQDILSFLSIEPTCSFAMKIKRRMPSRLCVSLLPSRITSCRNNWGRASLVSSD